MIYKIFREVEYTEFVVDGQSQGAPIDQADGYIHFSTAKQLAGTLAKHFAGENDLFLLAVDDKTLDNLKWEPSRNDQLFPHLYRPLRRGDVEQIWELDGHRLPKGLE